MAFLRFVTSRSDADSGVEAGIFTVAYSLQDSAAVRADDRECLKGHLAWFERHLRKPDRFNRSGSKGYYRRKTRGIAWFRDSASGFTPRRWVLQQAMAKRSVHTAG